MSSLLTAPQSLPIECGKRHALRGIPVLLLIASALSAAEYYNADGFALTGDVLSYGAQSFDMGLIHNHWNSGQRFELNGWAQYEDSTVQPSGGLYGFYESRSFTGQNLEDADYYAWGLGLQGGATINLIPPQRYFRLGLAPYARGGLGGQNLTVHNVLIDDDNDPSTPSNRYSLSAGSGRAEVAAGLDLRMIFGRHVTAVIGVGVDYWSAANVYVSSGSSGSSLAVIGNSYAFSGTDAFFRFGAGVWF